MKGKVLKYLIITFLITYIAWWLRAVLVSTGVFSINDLATNILFYIGSFGPAIAAITVQEKRDLKSVLNFITNRKKKTVGYLILFIVLFAGVSYISNFELNPEIKLTTVPFFDNSIHIS